MLLPLTEAGGRSFEPYFCHNSPSIFLGSTSGDPNHRLLWFQERNFRSIWSFENSVLPCGPGIRSSLLQKQWPLWGRRRGKDRHRNRESDQQSSHLPDGRGFSISDRPGGRRPPGLIREDAVRPISGGGLTLSPRNLLRSFRPESGRVLIRLWTRARPVPH